MQKIKCDHCHLSFDKEVMIEDGTHHFCCKGCQGVFHILTDNGLDSFYTKLANKTLTPPKEFDNDLSRFDLPSFYDQFVKTTKENFKQIDLIIEGIHCAACVWLNEKILYDTNGIIEAHINFSNNKAKITWDDEQLKLSEIIEKIRSIGYNAFAYQVGQSDKIATKASRDYFMKMMVAVFAAMNIMMLGVAKYTGFFTGIDEEVKQLIHIGEFIMATPVLFYSGFIFFRGAYFGLKNKIVNMDLLVATGASFTYIYSIFVLFGLSQGESYFDSVVMIITFVLVGKYLEVLGKKYAVDTLDTIRSQIPTEATIIKNNEKHIVPLAQVQIKDIIELIPGEKASVDGILLSDGASFDESSVTGESLPVYKKHGDKIISGTICTESIVRYECTADFEHSTLNHIVTLLEDSLASKPKIEELANRISKYFSLSILLIATCTFILWYFGNFNYYDLPLMQFEKAFIVAISVIVIACPCALALATPIATLIGISSLAKNGIIFKESKHIETMANATMAIFDKTGTLTEGKLQVQSFNLLQSFDISLLYSLVQTSKHPMSQSISLYLQSQFPSLKTYPIQEHLLIAGKGIKTLINGHQMLGGNAELLKDFGITHQVNTLGSIFLLAIDGQIVLEVILQDELKQDAKELIATLQKHHLKVVMLTGDNEQVAKKIANELGIHYEASLTPIQKASYVQNAKNNHETVVCIGDGINDALMLSSSNIAIAMGNGTDVAISVSDVVVLNSSLTSLKEAFLIAKKTYKFIKQNLLLSLIYNLITIPIAIAGYVIPLVAALSMSLSSLLVVGNSMRIKNNSK